MNQTFKAEKLYKRTNGITQITTAFIALVCLFAMTSVGFTVFASYARLIDLAFLTVAFLFSGNMTHMKKRNFFYILFLLTYFLLTLPFTGGGVGSIAAPVMTVLWIQIMQQYKLTKSLERSITVMFSLLFMSTLIRCPDYFTIWTAEGETGLNPNTLAILIVISSSIILILNQNNRTYKKYHFFIPQILLTFWGVFNYKSRASLLMFIVFVAFKYLLPVKIKKSRKVACFICISCVIAGLLFPVIYIYLYQNMESLQIPVLNSLVSEKSFFTGRQRIWNNIFVELSKKNFGWLFGIGSKADIGLSGLGSHNSFMLLLMNFGLCGTVFYYSFYLFYIKKIYSRGIPFIEQVDFIYLGFSYFVLNFFETAIMCHHFIIFAIVIWGIPQGYKYTSSSKMWINEVRNYKEVT